MKRIFFALVAGCLPALIGISGANAQSPVNSVISKSQKNINEIENVMTSKKDHIMEGAICPKALKDFAKTYKNVTVGSWDKSKDGFAVRFILDGIWNMVYYNTRGNWIGNLKGYSEDKLPRNIRNIVKSEYYDYSIIYVREVETIDSRGISTYIIFLEDKNRAKSIRVRDGEMEVIQEFEKS